MPMHILRTIRPNNALGQNRGTLLTTLNLYLTMIPVASVADALIVTYLALGSGTWGYIFLRTGWPNIRQLEPSYKKGWSLAFGIAFATLMALIAQAASYFYPGHGSVLELIFIGAPAVFISASLVFSFKRKFLKKHRVTVSVPKRVVTAGIVARLAMDRIPLNEYMRQEPLAAGAGGIGIAEMLRVETRESMRAGGAKKEMPLNAQADIEIPVVTREPSGLLELRPEKENTKSVFVALGAEKGKNAPQQTAKKTAKPVDAQISPLPNEGIPEQKISDWAAKPLQSQGKGQGNIFATPPKPIFEKRRIFDGLFGKNPKQGQSGKIISPVIAQKKIAQKISPAVNAAKEVMRAERESEIMRREMERRKALEIEYAQLSVEQAERESEIIRQEIYVHETYLAKAKISAAQQAAKKAAPGKAGIFSSITGMFSEKKRSAPAAVGTPQIFAPKQNPVQPAKNPAVQASPLHFQNSGPAPAPKNPVFTGRAFEHRKRLVKPSTAQSKKTVPPVAKEPTGQFEYRQEISAKRLEELRRRLFELERAKSDNEDSAKSSPLQSRTTLESRLEMASQEESRRDGRKFTEDVLKILERKSLENKTGVSSKEQTEREVESSRQFIIDNVRQANLKEAIAHQSGAYVTAAQNPHPVTALPRSAMLLKQLLKEESV